MKKQLTHYGRTLRAEITISPQLTLSAQNILRDDPDKIAARSFTITSNIMGFNYMNVIGVQQYELLELVERVEQATHAYMELMYQNRATESFLAERGYK